MAIKKNIKMLAVKMFVVVVFLVNSLAIIWLLNLLV